MPDALSLSGAAPVRNGRRLAERAYQELRDAIQEGRLEPGQRMLETELCGWLKVSRTPVREALRRLQSESLLEYAHGGGLAVTSHDLRAVTELYEVRESLEATAAGLAARSVDTAELRLLQAMVDAQRRMPADPALHAHENTLFHAEIHRAAHNRFLLRSLQGLHDALVLLGRTTYIAPDRIATAVAEHAAIVDAVARRDESAAAEIARQHVRRGYELRVQLMTASLAASSLSPS